jgi:hypothetical protein
MNHHFVGKAITSSNELPQWQRIVANLHEFLAISRKFLVVNNSLNRKGREERKDFSEISL